MRIEARRYHDQVGPEIPQPRQDDLLERGAELPAVVAGAQRRVDDRVVLAALGDGAGTGIKRHLVGRAIHHARVRPEDLLRAVAVVHVEIHDRDPLQAVPLLRMARRDRRIVEQAETHRPRGLGMVAGRAHRHERIGGALCRSPRRPPAWRRRPRAAPPRSCRATWWCRRRAAPAPASASPPRSRSRNRADGRARWSRSWRAGASIAGEVLELLLLERLLDRAQAIGPLRMAGRRQVVETGRVGDEQGGHDRHLWVCKRGGKGAGPVFTHEIRTRSAKIALATARARSSISAPGQTEPVCAMCGPPLFLVPRAEIRLQNQDGSL